MDRKSAIKIENLRNESCWKEEVVNTQGLSKASSTQATTEGRILQITCNNLMEKIIEKGNTRHALRRVERNDGAPGVDGMGVKDLKSYLNQNWHTIKEQLLNGTYKPAPVRRVEIPKPDGGKRLLGIPTALDRFIQQAILNVLTPIYDPQFSEHSYGFRPERSAKQAIRRAKQYINEGKRIVVDMDLEKFFDRVNHDKLMGLLRKEIKDEQLNKLIAGYLKSRVMLNGCCVATEEGTPQGGPLSPLLANIMLNELDKELEGRGHCFARYADDCNIYVKSKRAGDRVMQSVTRFIEKQLKLKVNQDKSAVATPWERKFLGISFTDEVEVRVRMASKSIERFKERIRQLTARSRGISLKERIKKLNEYLVGWSNYFGIIQTEKKFGELQGWLHRRMRMCLLKHWKQPKTIQRNLVAMGLRPSWAAKISGSGKGYWRLATSHQMNTAFGRKFWESQKLVSMVEMYKEIAHA